MSTPNTPAQEGPVVDPTDVEYLVTLLEQAVRRVELENRAGNPILSAWADDARQAIKDFDGDAAPARRFLSEMAAINLEATLTRKPAPEPLPEGVIDCAWRTAEEG